MMGSHKDKACEFLRSRGIESLAGAISTGSGQALSAIDLPVRLEVAYEEIPGMDDPSVYGHAGVLRVLEGSEGDWAVWIGRRHFYQGYTYGEIGFYVDVSSSLGASDLVCLNAAGGLDESLRVGDLVVIERFKCFIPVPGVDPGFDGGPWQETSRPLADRLNRASGECGLVLGTGTYIGVSGPTYETAAEVRWLRGLGCRIVGMSTVPELMRAAELGMNATAVSLIANVHGGESRVTHEEVVESSERSAHDIDRLISEFLRSGS